MKTFKSKIIFGIIAAIVAAPIVCCLPQISLSSVLAQNLEKTAVCCHKASGQNQGKALPKACDCHKLSAFLQNQNSNILKSPTSVSFLLRHHFMADPSFNQFIKGQTQRLAFYLSFPSFEGAISLYLKNSILRI